MDSATKFSNLLACKKPASRGEIPIYPMILTWCGTAAGMPQAELLASNENWQKAMVRTFEVIGRPDVFITTCAKDAVFAMGLPVSLPGRELGPNALYQFIEKPNMTVDDYRLIVQRGWDAFYNAYMMRIQKPPMKGQIPLILRFIKLGSNMGKNIKYFSSMGMVPIYSVAMAPAFDSLCMIRSMEAFPYDLYEEPGPLQDALRRATPDIIKGSITNARRVKGDRVGIFAMRSSCSFISPAMFEEFSWPYLKQTIEAFYKAGITSVLHADGNWLPLMHYFRELPKGSMHIELDGVTDIFKAHAILDGWQSVRGDVPAAMLAFGTPDQVSAYCEKLISELGMKGGFMLGSGCEVPIDAKLENVKAMMAAVK